MCTGQQNNPAHMQKGNDRNGISAILFDMDNTLFDLVGAQIAACDHVVRYLGNHDGEELFSYFLNTDHGFESPENIRQYMTERRISTDGMFDEACRIYHAEKLRHIVPYTGVSDTLRTIAGQGYPMGIVTDAEKKDAVPRLAKCDILPYFDCMVTFDMVNKKKPAAEPFLAALAAMNLRPDQVLFVGDSPRRDIEPCRKLGITTVYARYGDRFLETRGCIGADYCIDTMDELPGILERL
ncbi:MAG: HAD family hydrolase [Methanoregula sp.]